MGSFRISIAVAAVSLVSTAGAYAADMPSTSVPVSLPPPAYQTPAPAPFAGWYLRGDLGYRWQRATGEVAPGFGTASNEKLGNAVMAGFGAGIKSGWFRTDITLDFSTPAKYEATVATAGDTTAKIQTFTTMFNGYLDLGSWYRLSPYVGGGIGAARLRVTEFSSTAAPPFTGDGANTRWNLAWAAMAGVGYQIAPNLLVDVGYRYINFGNVSTLSDNSGNMTFKNVSAHEVRLGLRWNFEDMPISR
jgi:opacity protein-like surface antigen